MYVIRKRASVADDVTIFFLPEFVVDGSGQYQFDLPLFWVSSPGLDEVALEMDLARAAEVGDTRA